MQALIDVARSRGLRTMEGLVAAAPTRPMLHFARQLGFELRGDPDDHDTVRVLRSL
jgi:L-amino acid N-acyltransferase YncA